MMKNENQKIKILFRHRSMEMGGVEKVMLSLLNNLDREKFDMTVLLSLNQGELRDEFPQHVRKVFLADGKEGFSENSLIQKFQLAKRRIKLEKLLKNPEKIDRQILKENYDIEIAMSYNDFEPVLNSSNKKSKKIGWFHSEINTPGFEPLVPPILENFPKFDKMVYCSQRIYDLMHENHPNLDYPDEQVIINAIPTEEIRKKSGQEVSDFPAAHNPVFISVGRLHFRKGYHKLAEAHAKLLQDGFRHTVIIIGEGEQRAELEKLIEDLKITDTFLLLGNRMNPYPYIKKANFFILSSSSEAWPLVIAEAMILQKPVIATNTGDISTMVENRKTGLLINFSKDEMYEAMKEFITNKNLIATIEKNLENVDELFDNRKIFDSVEKALIDILK